MVSSITIRAGRRERRVARPQPAHRQRPPRHTNARSQSELTRQSSPRVQRAAQIEPPQSTSVSSWFWIRSKHVGGSVVVDDENVVETVVLVVEVVVVEDEVEVELVVVGKSRNPRHTHPPATAAHVSPRRHTPSHAGNVRPHPRVVGSHAHPILSPSTT